jgi:signal transduction histidine kinase/CheY-like chemotaxis protein
MLNAPQPAFLAGNSAMAALMRSHDWSRTDVGAPATWPQSLRSVVHLMLGSGFPMFVAWGPKLEMLYNDAYAEILGKKHPASLASPFRTVWYDILDDIMPLVNRALAGETFYIENLLLRMQRKGYEEDTWFTFSYSAVLDESGATAGFYCACAETTATVLAERRQRAEQERLQALFQQAPGFVAVLRGPEHRFEVTNPAYIQLTGGRELLGRNVGEALPEAEEQGFIALLDEVYRSGKPYVGRALRFLFQADPAGTREAFVDFVYQPLLDDRGAVDGIFVYGYEVTEQQRAQEETRRAAQALQEADRQKDEFLATLAHELRNPLAPIRTAVHLLSMPNANDSTRQRAVQIVGRQVTHMSRLLDDLIDIARITQRRLVLKREWVQVQSVVDTALEASSPAAEAKRHTLTAHVDQPLQWVNADPVRLAQVLANLLNNAAKYTDPGGRIALDVRAEDGWLCFCVTDTGIGMSAEALQNVFAMFAQEQSALDRSEGGLGIGLALAKGLVELHGGTISAHSAGVGRGSRFEVRLPLAARSEDAAPQEAQAHAPVPSASRLVLLADDNADAAEVLAELLRLAGHQVRVANDGHAASDLAAQLRPHVLVLDIGMPGLNGYEVARQVRAHDWGANALLIAATGWGQEDDRRKALEAGFDLHFTKPFSPEQLLAAIAQRDG